MKKLKSLLIVMVILTTVLFPITAQARVNYCFISGCGAPIDFPGDSAHCSSCKKYVTTIKCRGGHHYCPTNMGLLNNHS